MARKRADNKNKSLLKREYHVPLPDNKVGDTLGRQVKGPKFWQNFRKYVSGSRTELKKVTWPSRKESWRLTFAVILFTAIFAAYTTVIDLGFEQLVQRLFI